MAEIHLQDGESLESALKHFKRKVMNEEIIKDIKKHAFYLVSLTIILLAALLCNDGGKCLIIMGTEGSFEELGLIITAVPQR